MVYSADQATRLFPLSRGPRWFLRWVKPPATSLALGTFADLTRNKSELLAGNALLGQQLIVLRRQIKRLIYRKTDWPLLVLLARLVLSWRQALFLVPPETLLRWHRELFRFRQRPVPHKAAGSCGPGKILGLLRRGIESDLVRFDHRFSSFARAAARMAFFCERKPGKRAEKTVTMATKSLTSSSSEEKASPFMIVMSVP